MFTIPRLRKIEAKRNTVISKDIKICLECGSGIVEELEFAISCEECGVLIQRS